MDTAIKTLETKALLALPLGSPLVLSWYQEGARFAAAQLIAKKNSELILNVWKAGGKDPGVKPEVWTLKVDGGFLTDSRRQFRCTLQLPSEKELASIKDAMEKFPHPPCRWRASGCRSDTWTLMKGASCRNSSAS